MSVEQPDPEPETVLVAPAHGNKGVLHLRDGTDVEEDRPLCHATRRDGTDWMPRDLDAYPPAWREWCKGCLNQVRRGRWP